MKLLFGLRIALIRGIIARKEATSHLRMDLLFSIGDERIGLIPNLKAQARVQCEW